MFFLLQLFVTYFYQPLFNLLVGIYMLMDKITSGHADMGIAVIFFTIAFRVIWLPISLSTNRSVKEQHEIMEKIKQIKSTFIHDPVGEQVAIKTLLRNSPKALFSSAVDLFFQVLIALMLWRIFALGLEGAHFHLLYSFMPKITHPFNLMFLGKYDLSKPNITLNIIQSIAIFIFEIVNAVFSISFSRRDMVRTQIFLPIVSFLIFLNLPAGKKLFIITTLIFSITQKLIINGYYALKSFGTKAESFGQKMAGVNPSTPSAPISQEPHAPEPQPTHTENNQ